jgi:hypothetical protein
MLALGVLIDSVRNTMRRYWLFHKGPFVERRRYPVRARTGFRNPVRQGTSLWSSDGAPAC